MIKATGHNSAGTRVLLLGLTYANLRRLKEDEPIEFDGTPYGYPGNIMIYAGPTEAAMGRKLIRDNPGVVTHVEPDAP